MSSNTNPQRAYDWFGEPLTTGELKRRSVRGILVSITSRSANQLVGIGSLVFLARMLTPGDFGLIAMIAAVVGIAGVLQDLGFSAATVRTRKITHEQISNLFWINVVAGVTITLLVAASSHLLQNFYADSRVQAATIAMSLNFALGGASTQHQALLRRAMRFSDIARITIISAVATAAVSITAAYYDAGYWSLILGSLSGNIVSLILSWNFCDWHPGRPSRHVGTRPLALFGLHMTIFGAFGFLANNLHNLIIGRYWGATETGLYNRSANLQAMLMGNIVAPLGQVAPAAMAQLSGEPNKFNNYYYKGCALAVMSVMPIIFVGLILPYELVRVLLGEQWDRTASLLRLLAIGILPQTISHTTGWIYLSAGNSVQMMRWGVIGWTAIIIGTVTGSFFGLEGIALAASVTAILLVVPCLVFAFNGTSLNIPDLMRSLTRPVVAGLIAGVICYASLCLLVSANSLTRLFIGGAGYIIIYASLLMTVFGQRDLILDILSQLKKNTAAVNVDGESQ